MTHAGTRYHRVLDFAATGPQKAVSGGGESRLRVLPVREGPNRWTLVMGPFLTDDTSAAAGGLGAQVRPQDVRFDALGAPDAILPVVEAVAWDRAQATLTVQIVLPVAQAPEFCSGLYHIHVALPQAVPMKGVFELSSDTTPDQTKPFLPAVDYLAKDYGTIRASLFDRMSQLIPDWQDNDPADIGTMILEVLAYEGDRLSYAQDAVAQEAYLGTARLRRSVKRHARLLGYDAHDGVNSRTWLSFTVNKGAGADACLTIPAGLDAVTGPPVPDQTPMRVVMDLGRMVYRTLEPLKVHAGLNQLEVYNWGMPRFSLPVGTTSAVFVLPKDAPEALLHQDLWRGRVLVFEQRALLQNGRRIAANPSLRHAVRVSSVEIQPRLATRDSGRLTVFVTWRHEDALPFELSVSDVARGDAVGDLCFASGNCVLADLGLTVDADLVPDHVGDGPFCPMIALPDSGVSLIRAVPWDRSGGRHEPAAAAMSVSPDQSLPALTLRSSFAPELAFSPPLAQAPQSDWVETWTPANTLLGSSRNDRLFVAEDGFGGQTTLRFGDGASGSKPQKFRRFRAQLRIAERPTDAMGADAIKHMAPDVAGWHRGLDTRGQARAESLSYALAAIETVRNPLPAVGGMPPEDKDTIRNRAPYAADTVETCYSLPDFEKAASAWPDVAEAHAVLTWSGARHVVAVFVSRRSGRPATSRYRADLGRYLNKRKVIGVTVEVRSARSCPVDIVLEIDVAPHHVLQTVLAACEAAFDPQSSDGFFGQARWPMGQMLFASDVIARAMAVSGVAQARLLRFSRLDVPINEGQRVSAITPARFEKLSATLKNAQLPRPVNGCFEVRCTGGGRVHDPRGEASWQS